MRTHRTLIVKLAGRCNLACPYCYMYAYPDQSWRARPARMGPEARRQLLQRVGELLDHEPDTGVTLELHGGEPLLAGLPAVAELLEAVATHPRVGVCLQTNGVLLDQAWCELFARHGVHWSISLDGPAPVHDRYRPTTAGGPSHAATEAAVRRSLAWPGLFGGVLAVLDPSVHGGELLRYFHGLGVRDVDFLLPDATWVTAPPHLPAFSVDEVTRCMLEAFEAWQALDDPDFRFRYFENLTLALMGRRPELDCFGGSLDQMLVVETDGSYQHLDVLHICGEQYTTTGGSLGTRSLSDQFARLAGAFPPAPAACTACPVFDICGGGYLPHRFDGQGFNRPSVYCDTLMATIGATTQWLRAVTPAHAWG